jgi:hypothetical protein
MDLDSGRDPGIADGKHGWYSHEVTLVVTGSSEDLASFSGNDDMDNGQSTDLSNIDEGISLHKEEGQKTPS